MTPIVHFEVYYYDVERGDWTLQARYPSDEKHRAIDEAKVLEFSQNLPVKVVRDAYNAGTNMSDEDPVFVGRIKPAEARRRAQARQARRMEARRWAQGGSNDLAGDGPLGGGSAKATAKSTADFAFRLIIVMIAALAVAILGTGLISMLSAKLFLSLGLANSTQSLIMFLIFMGLFLMSAVPLVMLYVPLESVIGGGTEEPRKTATPEAAQPKAPAETPAPKTATVSADAAVEAAVAAVEAEHARPTPQPAEDTAAAAEKAAKVTPAETTPQAPEDVPPAQETAPDAAQADAAPSPEAGEPAEDSAPPEESVALEQARLIMMKFLGGAVSALKLVRPQLDAYNKFGVNLYFTGASEALAEAKRLNDAERRLLISEAVEVIGTRPEHAGQLIDRMDTYKSQPRYRQMIASGKVAMEVHLTGSSDPFIAMGGVIKDWNTPQAQQVASSSAVTIMFTDMVGSTDITHMIGDAAAQDIIRAHNHIVRGALARHRGKEVKHTGDGIMASFDSASDAVAAAIEIQKKAADHSERWTNQPLELRIGMNTGEPIVEENDYFGATVQIAARVCATAGSGQIWLSADTYDSLSATARDEIFDHGRQHLKGVQGETGLYEVAWTETRRQDLAVEAAERATQAAEGADGVPSAPEDGGTEAAPGAAPGSDDTPAPQDTPETTAAPPRAKPNLDQMPPPPPPRRPRRKAADQPQKNS